MGRRNEKRRHITFYVASVIALLQCLFVPLISSEWTKVSIGSEPGPGPRTAHSMVLVKNRLLVVFGGLTEKKNAREETQYHGMNDTWMYDLKGKKWFQLQNVTSPVGPTPRFHHIAFVSHDTRISEEQDKTVEMFVYGGITSAQVVWKPPFNQTTIPANDSIIISSLPTFKDRVQTDELWRLRLSKFIEKDGVLTPHSISWSLVSQTNGPMARSEFSGVVFMNTLYLYGGLNGTTALRDFWQFDLKTLTWQGLPNSCSNCPPGRHGHMLGILRINGFTHLVLFGGTQEVEDESMSSTMWLLPFASNIPKIWTYSMGSHGVLRKGTCFVSEGDQKYSSFMLIGGYDPTSGLVYNDALITFVHAEQTKVDTKRWTYFYRSIENDDQEERMTPRFDHTSVQWQNQTIIYGGWGGKTNLSIQEDMWMFNQYKSQYQKYEQPREEMEVPIGFIVGVSLGGFFVICLVIACSCGRPYVERLCLRTRVSP